jgi:type IV pilus assembly protein PilW
MTHPHLNSRGFTLIELVVAVAATVILIAGAMTLLIQQQRAYQAGTQDRGLEESGRLALGELTSRLREAGYGVDPPLVFDFGDMDGLELTAVPQGSLRFKAGAYRCATAVDCRDRIDGPDELVFLTRNPRFSRPVAAVTPSQITLTGDLATPLHQGQLLQVMCLTGSQVRAYVTVDREVPAVSPQNPLSPVAVPIVTGAGDFPDQTDFFTDPCFGSETIAVKVDRSRYHVATFDAAGNEVAWGTPDARPWLMLDTGTFDVDGALIDVPVTPDVEDLQVAYLFPPGDPLEINRVVGAEQGVLASAEAYPLTVGIAPPRYDAEPDNPSRLTGNPANIQAVRVAIVVRSPEPDITYATLADRTLPAAGNRPDLLGPVNYRRMRFESTVVVYNMQSRYLAYPMVNTAGGRGFNVGGG